MLKNPAELSETTGQRKKQRRGEEGKNSIGNGNFDYLRNYHLHTHTHTNIGCM